MPKPARKSLNGRFGWFTRAMDPQSQAFTPYSSNNETWRLQSDIVRFQQVQAEHAERIARLERRQEDDARMKSVWGQTSPFPSVLSGTPQQGEIYILPLLIAHRTDLIMQHHTNNHPLISFATSTTRPTT